jgi:hypothetical protein
MAKEWISLPYLMDVLESTGHGRQLCGYIYFYVQHGGPTSTSGRRRRVPMVEPCLFLILGETGLPC